jgi:transcriptional regulator with XRE-family HTH domain
MTPGEYLREIREDSKRTLKDVGEASGYNHTYLSDIERGRRELPLNPTRRLFLLQAYGANPARVEALQIRHDGKVDISDLPPADREEIAEYIARFRARREERAA